jgi:hypothetical protein
MKSFFQFISEATSAADQAQRLGLQGDGHGGWYDRRTNEFVAKTEGGKLKFYNKRQRVGKDPNQTPHEKDVPSPSYNDPNAQQQPQPEPQPEPAPEQQPVAQEPQQPVGNSTHQFLRPRELSQLLLVVSILLRLGTSNLWILLLLHRRQMVVTI